MLAPEQIDQLLCLLASWDRDVLLDRFLGYRSRFPVDLTPEFLRQMPVDQLRHVFLAVCRQNSRMPEGAASGNAVAA